MMVKVENRLKCRWITAQPEHSVYSLVMMTLQCLKETIQQEPLKLAEMRDAENHVGLLKELDFGGHKFNHFLTYFKVEGSSLKMAVTVY
jgi:hypothetical protein